MRALIFCAVLALAAPATAAETVEKSLLADIKKSEQALATTEARIADERGKLAARLGKLEQEVLALRQKTAVARRLQDEKTLSLSDLENRLADWRKQHAYQQNLLSRFLRQQDAAEGATGLGDQIAAVTKLADGARARLRPSWQNRDVVTKSGEILPMATLSLGPVTWYWNKADETGGLAGTDGGLVRVEVPFSGGDVSALEDLATTGKGNISLDPSLSRAVALAEQKESALEHLTKGGIWVIPILLFGLFATAIALVKAWQLWRLPRIEALSPTHLSGLMARGDADVPAAIAGMQRRLLDIAFDAPTVEARDDRLFMELQSNRHWLERWTGAIAMTASVSPLLGLLGTVSGMIETFKMMTLFGSGDPQVVSGGIAQALITTELGLIIAIPALILNAILSRRAKAYYGQLEQFALQLSQDGIVDQSAMPARPRKAKIAEVMA